MLSDRYHDNKDDSQNPRSISQRTPNTIELVLTKENFASNEPAVGHVLINLTETFEAKKLTLSILGEIVSQGAAKLTKKQSTFKKLKTSLSGIGRPNIQRTFTAKKEKEEPAQAQPADNRRMSRTLTRTFTIMSRMAMSPNAKLQNSKSIVPEMRNRELFCHYNIPVFTFKTSTLPPGVYKIPFKFTFSTQMIPTAEFNGDNKNFQLGVAYKIVADLEENADEDYFEERMINHFPMKCVKEIRIYKPTNAQKKALETAQPQTLITDVSGKLRIPTALCFARNDIDVKLKLDITTFVLGDTIKFTLESFNKLLKQGKTKIFLNIVEMLSSFGNKHETPKVLVNPTLTFKDSDSTSARPGTLVTGEVVLPKTLPVTFSTPSMNTEHVFELILTYSAGIKKQGISLRIPVILKKEPDEPKDSQRRRSAFRKHEEEPEVDENIMVLPLAKFKLDEKFNLLTRTAEMMNHEFL